ncbi:helix-turn-helix domain-containing protein [Lawsonibacter celer]|uniref:helix-turn-helix domain-containing protein n=1 Tax=Lawsonibacter celer TaxID=2986526 RepID=UPI00164463C5
MTHTEQEKAAIVTQYRQGKPIQELCAERDISERTLYRLLRNSPKAGVYLPPQRIRYPSA